MFSFRSREKNVLDFSSYRSGYFTINWVSMAQPDHLDLEYQRATAARTLHRWGRNRTEPDQNMLPA
jgi:hypothetical protein